MIRRRRPATTLWSAKENRRCDQFAQARRQRGSRARPWQRHSSWRALQSALAPKAPALSLPARPVPMRPAAKGHPWVRPDPRKPPAPPPVRASATCPPRPDPARRWARPAETRCPAPVPGAAPRPAPAAVRAAPSAGEPHRIRRCPLPAWALTHPAAACPPARQHREPVISRSAGQFFFGRSGRLGSVDAFSGRPVERARRDLRHRRRRSPRRRLVFGTVVEEVVAGLPARFVR